MKKFLCAVLAGVMAMSLTVTAFAADIVYGSGVKNHERTDVMADEITIDYVRILRDGEEVKSGTAVETEDFELRAGDALYFALNNANTGSNIGGKADGDWVIKVRHAQYIEDVEFYTGLVGKGTNEDSLWVKMTLRKDFNSYEADRMDTYFYIYDTDERCKSSEQHVVFSFEDYEEMVLTETMVEDFIDLQPNVLYTLDSAVKSAKVTFYYDDMFFIVPMYVDDEFVFNGYTVEYNKELSKKYEQDIELITFYANTDDYTVFIESAKDDMFFYNLVDGKFVKADYKYAEEYTLLSDEYIELDGYVFSADVIDDLVISEKEIKVEEVVAPETKPENDPPKENPSTGAELNPNTGAGAGEASPVFLIIAGVAFVAIVLSGAYVANKKHK